MAALYWPSDMRSSIFRRRAGAALGLYASVALGILGSIVAARTLGLEGFGLYATALTAASFLQTLLDLTVEEALTKYGFRYVTGGEWGRLRRLFRRALDLKLLGGALATLVLLALAPAGDWIFGGQDLLGPMLAAAAIPLVQSPEGVASTALLLRERYDLRAGFLVLSMGLRLAGIAIGAQLGVAEAILGLVAGQALSTAAVSAAGLAAFRRFPPAEHEALGADRREILRFVLQSSGATGMLSLRQSLAPLLLGVVAGPTSVGLFRVAQAPQSGLASLSSPARLILLTEQTRDWERGDRRRVVAGVLRYSLGAAALMAVTLPFFVWLMPDLIRIVFGSQFLGATDAARIIAVAAALQFVYGWAKSIPVSIGRPLLRIYTHGAETAVLLPLVLVLGAEWEVTGAAVALLVSTLVFVAAWTAIFLRLRRQVTTERAAPRPQEALAP
jgi:O-antigen/teichoic acid export membrane protein